MKEMTRILDYRPVGRCVRTISQSLGRAASGLPKGETADPSRAEARVMTKMKRCLRRTERYAPSKRRTLAFFRNSPKLWLLGRANQHLADERLRLLGDQHCDCVRHVFGLKHLQGVFAVTARTKIGID